MCTYWVAVDWEDVRNCWIKLLWVEFLPNVQQTVSDEMVFVVKNNCRN